MKNVKSILSFVFLLCSLLAFQSCDFQSKSNIPIAETIECQGVHIDLTNCLEMRLENRVQENVTLNYLGATEQFMEFSYTTEIGEGKLLLAGSQCYDPISVSISKTHAVSDKNKFVTWRDPGLIIDSEPDENKFVTWRDPGLIIDDDLDGI